MSRYTEMPHTNAEALLARDPAFAALIADVGSCTLQADRDSSPLQALARSVCYQQLHTKAGDKIHARFLQQFSNPHFSAAQLLAVSEATLRAVGLSQRKVATLYALAQAEQSGLLPQADQVANYSDEELIARISQIRGIGPWTVQMWLMFHEGRQNVWPVLDFGVREGYKRLYQLAEAPTPRQLQALGEPFQPYRSIAAWYLWRAPKQALNN